MVEVLRTGLFDSIQDLGRSGFQEFGVPFSGVMDRDAANLANSILNNESNAAVIESTATGPKLKFHTNTIICITGAFMNPTLNGVAHGNNLPISVTSGAVLEFGSVEYGFRTYIAVAGGFQTETVMNSRSMYKNITSDFRLRKGDKLPILEGLDEVESVLLSDKFSQNHFLSNSLEVYKGAEFDYLSSGQQNVLFEDKFCISKDSNRMACRLEERLENQLDQIITSLVLPGTVQLTPSGELIALMRDAQTTGGYPRVLQLSEKAINILSQKSIKSIVQFKLNNW